MAGLFITFEGVESCGKSTQARLLADYLRASGLEVLLTREPGGPKISEAIRRLLLDKDNQEMLPETEFLLYLAARAQHTGEFILPALQEGKIVICDRYADSTFAYQGAARQIDLRVIEYLRPFSTYNLEPHLTFLIDIDPLISLKRLNTSQKDRLELEALAFHQAVRNGFLQVASKEKKRYIVLNGLLSIEALQQEIQSIVLRKVK